MSLCVETECVADNVQEGLMCCTPYSQLMNIGARRAPPRKIIMHVSVNDDVQLKKSENAWKPGMKRDGSAEDSEMQKTQVGPRLYREYSIH